MPKVIIIGAGLGGLTAGNLLTQKGHQVTIFESHTTPGGYIAGFWRKGFYFESGTLSFESSADVFRAMKEIGVFDKISFVKHAPFRFVSSDFDGVAKTYQEYNKMLYKAYPTEKDRLESYFRVVDRMYATFKAMYSEGAGFSKLINNLKMLLLYFQYKNVTIPQFTERYFPKGSHLCRLLSNISYPDSGAFILGGALWTIYDDYWTVKDGMQSWADVLAANFKQLGGDLKLKAPVEKILTRNNAAVGVVCGGTTYDADYVVSACDYKQTFQKLLDPAVVPPTFADKVSRASVSEGVVVVYLGLNISNETLQRIMQSPYAMCSDLTADVNVRNSQDETYFEHSAFSLYALSLENPKLAPDGKASLMITTTAPYRWLNNWGNGDRAEYQKLKERVRETLIRRASQVVPDLPNLIEFQDAATPLTFERFTHNTDGATSAWSWSPHKKFHKNFWSVKVTTPIDRLLIGSCWATQIGGIPGAIGAAQKCVKIIEK